MKRRDFIKAIGITATAGLSGMSPGAEGGEQPNVILVITDDQGYGDIACHGNKIIKTPHLDKLYTQSARLTNYHVGPTCAPTRCALMTGHYGNSTGVWHTIMGRSLLRKDELTMGDVFRGSGYRTAMFGKWHLGDNYPFRPRYRGFDHVVCHGGGGVEQTPDHWGNDYFDDTYCHNGKFVKHEGYCTDIWFDEAMNFIKGCADKKKKFFCYLSTNAPHGPFRAPQKYIDMYSSNKNVPNPAFYGMITNIDDNMGRLVKQLEDLKIAGDPILMFTTDNGTAAGFRKGKGFNAGMRGTKGSEYDGGHRVPMFIRWPEKIKAGKDIGRVTAHIDMLPTLAEICSLKKPDGVKWDGSSIVPLIKGDGKDWPNRVLTTDSQRIENPQKWRKSAVMTDKWRLVNGKELYAIQKDPGQKNNVADKNPEVVKKLRAEYDKWWEHTSGKFGEYCPIVIGDDNENPTRLTSHDWHSSGSMKSWNQKQIRSGPIVTGFWAVDVAKKGTYEFELRRWPREEDGAITKDYKLKVVKAKIKIGDIEKTVDVAEGAKKAVITVDLKAGETKLEATWLDAAGKTGGPYFVYAERK